MLVANRKEALREYIDSRRQQVFAYGFHDCGLFAAGAVKAQTGHDFAAEILASEGLDGYDEAAARELLAKFGGVAGIVTACLGEPIPPNHCCEGDVVEADLDFGPTLGVCLGVNCLFPGLRGLVSRPRSVIQRGWKVR